MDEELGRTRYAVQIETRPWSYMDEIRAAEMIAAEIRNRHPEAEITIEISVK